MRLREWPLRLRLTLAFTVAMAAVLAGLGAFVYARVGSDLLRGIDMDLRSRAQVVVDAARSHPGVVRSPGRLIDPDEAFAQVLAPPDRVVDSSSGVAGAPMLDRAQLREVAGPTFLTARVVGVDDPARLLAVPAGHGPGLVVVVVGATLGDRNEAMSRLLWQLLVAAPVALVLVAWGGWALAGAALRPVERMRREAAALSLSEPSRRLAVPPTRDELARLATTLNSMLDRLQESVQREQRFLDEASHELRTPLGVLRMELDLALSRARTPEELQWALRSAWMEADRLSRLAEHLLVLSRAAGGTLQLHRVETDLHDLLNQAASANSVKADAAGIGIDVDRDDGLAAFVDPERIRQAVDDLLDNAVRHGGKGSPVTLSVGTEDGRVEICVRDGGPGFPPDVLERAGVAGGRIERNAPGAGLGLVIVAAIARAHGGVLRLANLPAGGAEATLDLPAQRG